MNDSHINGSCKTGLSIPVVLKQIKNQLEIISVVIILPNQPIWDDSLLHLPSISSVTKRKHFIFVNRIIFI